MESATPNERANRTSLAVHALALSVIAFALHYAWERAQCPIFYVHGSFGASQWGMVQASVGDVLITWLVYGLIALISWRWRWTPPVWTGRQWLVLISTAMLVAVAVELHATSTGRWSYDPITPLMPVLGVSLIPILQLIILIPATFWIADRLLPAGPRPTATELVRARYDRIAPVYDLLESLMEFRFRAWRHELWQSVGHEQVLEVGLGTGKNLRFWPRTGRILGTDISEPMLTRARRKAKKLKLEASFEIADVQALPYDDNRFDTVVCTFLFCSVPDPMLGLREVRRVLKPGGRLLMVEHVLSKRPVIVFFLRLLDPISYRIWGAHLNRDTADAVKSAGFGEVVVTNLWLDVVVRIEAAKCGPSTNSFGADTT